MIQKMPGDTGSLVFLVLRVWGLKLLLYEAFTSADWSAATEIVCSHHQKQTSHVAGPTKAHRSSQDTCQLPSKRCSNLIHLTKSNISTHFSKQGLFDWHVRAQASPLLLPWLPRGRLNIHEVMWCTIAYDIMCHIMPKYPAYSVGSTFCPKKKYIFFHKSRANMILLANEQVEH